MTQESSNVMETGRKRSNDTPGNMEQFVLRRCGCRRNPLAFAAVQEESMMNGNLARATWLGLVGILMAVAFVGCAPGSVKQSGQQVVPQTEATAESSDWSHMFPGLEGIPKDQLFDHFLAGQFTMTDKDGTPFTVNLIPGTVNSISATGMTVTPNGQTTTRTFNVTPDTVVHAAPGRGSIQAIVEGDKVVAITRDTSQDAVMIAKHGPMFHKRMMDSMMALE